VCILKIAIHSGFLDFVKGTKKEAGSFIPRNRRFEINLFSFIYKGCIDGYNLQ
jgi:hypothetical protein